MLQLVRVDADLLVGSDGIWSKVRTQLDPSEAPQLPVWSGYTCFAAIAYTVPDDIADVGYKVYLGRRKYFVSVDVGGGRIQWYAFLNIPLLEVVNGKWLPRLPRGYALGCRGAVGRPSRGSRGRCGAPAKPKSPASPNLSPWSA